ncbi:hypothetical protein O181_050808 [Austropuccinia psidii MF-1]|uniref:Uncharacterized protein n=1 Tax=Austropuccinia psidii MF-1 TaxID=1389203 RepID=A0A9Q3E2G0_9BASI|nr:hypothetical protein [Austropuccinia psidii MF-1]
MYTSGTLQSQGTIQRTDKDFSEPEYQGLDTIVDGRTLREIIHTLHSPYDLTRTSNQRTGRMWVKFFRSTNSSNIYANGEWTTRGKGSQDKGESSHYLSHRRTTESDIAYYDSFNLTRSKASRLPSGFKPFRRKKISGQESPFFTIPGSSKEKKRIKGEKQDFFQKEAERVRTNDTEAFQLGERSSQEP